MHVQPLAQGRPLHVPVADASAPESDGGFAQHVPYAGQKPSIAGTPWHGSDEHAPPSSSHVAPATQQEPITPGHRLDVSSCWPGPQVPHVPPALVHRSSFNGPTAPHPEPLGCGMQSHDPAPTVAPNDTTAT
jgi:hypothetical protein